MSQTEGTQRESWPQPGPTTSREDAAHAAELPGNIYRYVLQASGWHQLWLVVLTVAVFLLEIVPLELRAG